MSEPTPPESERSTPERQSVKSARPAYTSNAALWVIGAAIALLVLVYLLWLS